MQRAGSSAHAICICYLPAHTHHLKDKKRIIWSSGQFAPTTQHLCHLHCHQSLCHCISNSTFLVHCIISVIIICIFVKQALFQIISFCYLYLNFGPELSYKCQKMHDLYQNCPSRDLPAIGNYIHPSKFVPNRLQSCLDEKDYQPCA